MTATDRTAPTDDERRQRVRAIVERLEASPYEHHRELAATLRRIEARLEQRQRPADCACPPGDTLAVCRRHGLYGDGVDGRGRAVDTGPAPGAGADTEGNTMAERGGTIAERVASLRDFEERAVALEERRRADFDAWRAELADHIAALTAGGHGVE